MQHITASAGQGHQGLIVPAAPLDPGIIVSSGFRAVQGGEGRSGQRAFEHAAAAAGHTPPRIEIPERLVTGARAA